MNKKLSVLLFGVVVILGFIYFVYSAFNEISEEDAIQIATDNYINFEGKSIQVRKYESNRPELQFFFQDKTPIYSVIFYSHTELKNWEGWVMINTQINARNGEIILTEVQSRDPEKVKW
ncbi:hypothetical protein [Pseudalkalibacillus sp. SCS-8]|uniref:hypothetical protein n=1 Tax=Pseudalkalibacillus nanhaiensis TaxID=3115291 RepID=UPI0032DB1861